MAHVLILMQNVSMKGDLYERVNLRRQWPFVFGVLQTLVYVVPETQEHQIVESGEQIH
jgi:hypothetical protein